MNILKFRSLACDSVEFAFRPVSIDEVVIFMCIRGQRVRRLHHFKMASQRAGLAYRHTTQGQVQMMHHLKSFEPNRPFQKFLHIRRACVQPLQRSGRNTKRSRPRCVGLGWDPCGTRWPGCACCRNAPPAASRTQCSSDSSRWWTCCLDMRRTWTWLTRCVSWRLWGFSSQFWSLSYDVLDLNLWLHWY